MSTATTEVSVSSFPSVSDPVASMLGNQIVEGIKAVIEANKILLANEDASTGIREIDKNLKDFVASETNDVSDKDQEIVKAVADMLKKQAAFKAAQGKARNLYRTNILKEDEVAESDTDNDDLMTSVKAKRKLVMEAVTLLGSYAEGNGLNDVVSWTKTLSVPQVGRAGSSTVGQKKPRAYVSVNGTTYESFGEAAKALTVSLSTDDNKVEITSPDLVTAWVEGGEKETFDFQGVTIKVVAKERKAA